MDGTGIGERAATVRAATLGAGLAALVAAATVPGGAAACGPESDCVLGDRTYRIALPDGEGPFGAIVFMHGYRGTAAGVMRNEGLREVARELGVALVAPKSGGEDWLIRNAPRKGFGDDSRELVFFDALLDDLAARFPVDPGRILATGFSAGGMMTWTLACHRGERFAAFMPIAGTFWAPIPRTCPGAPVEVLHIHGTQDTVVPIAGRPIADTRQGDVREAVAMFREAGGYAPAEGGLDAPETLSCEVAQAAGGERLALCLHGGGHSVSAQWLRFGYAALVGG